MSDTADIIIRSATPDDAPELQAIYGYYVEHTAISFEYDAPTEEEFRKRVTNTLIRFPYLVAEEGGHIVGYAYAGPLKTRRAYDHCCETSIYIDRHARRTGIGSRLYKALEEELLARDILNLYACVTDPIIEDEYLTNDSEKFHKKMGYALVGRFHRCGYKFGRWYNVIWLEKHLKAEPNETVADAFLTKKTVERLIASHITVSTMESCTGGLLASAITDVSGASEIYCGGFVTYSNEAKIMQGVPREVIEKHGVYSPECAKSMAQTCRRAYGSQVGVGVTGSLGRKDPANPDSVCGEVYYCVTTEDRIRDGQLTIPEEITERHAMKEYVVNRILEDMDALLLSGLMERCEKTGRTWSTDIK